MQHIQREFIRNLVACEALGLERRHCLDIADLDRQLRAYWDAARRCLGALGDAADRDLARFARVSRGVA